MENKLINRNTDELLKLQTNTVEDLYVLELFFNTHDLDNFNEMKIALDNALEKYHKRDKKSKWLFF